MSSTFPLEAVFTQTRSARVQRTRHVHHRHTTSSVQMQTQPPPLPLITEGTRNIPNRTPSVPMQTQPQQLALITEGTRNIPNRTPSVPMQTQPQQLALITEETRNIPNRTPSVPTLTQPRPLPLITEGTWNVPNTDPSVPMQTQPQPLPLITEGARNVPNRTPSVPMLTQPRPLPLIIEGSAISKTREAEIARRRELYRRMPVWNSIEERVIKGEEAPTRRNLRRYLGIFPFCELYVGQDKESIFPSIDSIYAGLGLNPMRRILMWNRRTCQVIRGRMAPRRREIFRFLEQYPDCLELVPWERRVTKKVQETRAKWLRAVHGTSYMGKVVDPCDFIEGADSIDLRLTVPK